jgi:hypothetical protein
MRVRFSQGLLLLTESTVMIDEDIRDYFFEAMKDLDDFGKRALLISMYGWLEGFAYENSEPLERMMVGIQSYID